MKNFIKSEQERFDKEFAPDLFDEKEQEEAMTTYVNYSDRYKSFLSESHQRLLKRIEEEVKKARSDEAPFSRDQLQFANNLIEQKNETLDNLLTLLRGE